MFIFAGHKCRSSESKRNLLPGARLLGEAIADYVTAKNSNNIAVDPKNCLVDVISKKHSD